MFYIFGGILAVSAVVVSFVGLKSEKFPGRIGPVVVLAFVALIGTAITYSVLNGQEESEHRAHELEHANAEIEHEEEEPVEEAAEPEAGQEAEAGKPSGKAEGGGATTLHLEASPDAIAYDTTALSASAGEVTIDFTNPSALQHDVAVEKDGEEIAKTDIIAEGEDSLSAELEPGDYTFLCTVPGHAEAGMEGTLTVE